MDTCPGGTMAEARTANFQAYCRLCLTDKQDQLKSVFGATADDRALQAKILQHVAVEITLNDKASKQICMQCITKINDWHSFKEQCVLNQNKLTDWTTSTNPNITTILGLQADMSFHIKDEPVNYDDNDSVIENGEIRPVIKNEPQDCVEEEYSDFPPPLTPYRNEDASSEESQDSMNSSQTGTTVDEEKRKCQHCGKVFANVSNRKKHEKQLHRYTPLDLAKRNPMNEIISPTRSTENGSAPSTNIDDSIECIEQESPAEVTEDTEKTTEPVTEADKQKIQFAAGLKLLEKNSTPISCEPLSKIELSYIEKCKAMVNMHKTLNCACHNVGHPNLKGLLSHLRSLRIWFPVFTCYNCMISFTDRSSFAKHHVKCNRGPLETIEKLSNLRKRSEMKIRLYQNYKCTSCKYLYFFHEEYCKHVDEDHASEQSPFRCSCKKTFDNLEEYKNHVYYSCLVNYYCDICFVTVKSIDDFLKHAQDKHDNSEGFILLQDDNYVQRKAFKREPTLTRENEEPADVVESPKSKPTEKVAANSPAEEPELSEAISLRPRRERRSSAKAPSLDSDEDEPSAKVNLRDHYSHLKNAKSKDSAKCPLCHREYSTYHNMLRHYRTHATEDNARDNVNAEEGEINDNESSSLYSCPDCGGMYTSDDWLNHLESHPIKKCDMCEKSFQFQTELDQHRSAHLNLKVYRDTKTNVYRSSMVSPSEMPICEMCNAVFSCEEDLEIHRQTHIEEYAAMDEMPYLEPLAIISEVKEDKKYPCTECDKVYASYNSLWGHNKDKHPNKALASSEYPKQCELCDKVCLTGTSFASHKRMHNRIAMGIFPKGKAAKNAAYAKKNSQDDESYHTCNRCFKVFSSKSNLKTHMESHKTSPSKGSPNKKISKKVWCDVCHLAFNNTEQLNKHKEDEHDGMPTLTKEDDEESKYFYACEICSVTFTSKVSLKKHTQEKHLAPPKSSKSLVYCRYCKISFESVMSLTKHMHVEHNETAKPRVVKEGPKEQQAKSKVENKPHKCSICKKPFQTLPALQAHFGWHKRSKTKLAPAAPEDSMLQRAVTEKVAKHVKVMNKVSRPVPVITPPEFQCSTCLCEFPNDTALQIHILETHRSVNAIMLIPRCNVCNKDFATQEEYETHKRFHDFLERQKKHEVTQQQQQLQQQQVQQVQVQGKSVKNFPCKYCNSAFSRSDSLAAHVKQNHKEFVQTEFKCNQCDRVFEKQNSLSIHLKVHEKQRTSGVNGSTSKPLFLCSICNMGFDLPKDLRTHTINAHPF